VRVHALNNLNLIEFYNRAHVWPYNIIFKRSALMKFRIGNIYILYIINYSGVGFVFYRYFFNFFFFRRGLFFLLLFYTVCYDYLLNEDEKFSIFYYIIIGKLLLVILRYLFLLRFFIRFPRVWALIFLI